MTHHLPATPRSSRKLVHLQILRGVAAALVVADHSFYMRVYLGISSPRYGYAATIMGDIGVSAFFILSGFLMVRQTKDMFGIVVAPLLFAYRRIVRIVPMYWIATVVWIVARIRWHDVIPHLRGQVLSSLFFLPNFYSLPRMQPVLLPGWTLNYEVAFYVLFAFCLFLPRRAGLITLMSVLFVAFEVGSLHFFNPGASVTGFLYFYTQPYIGLFLCGALMAVVEREMKRVPRVTFPVSPALLLLVPATLILISPTNLGARIEWGQVTGFIAVVVLLCSLESDRAPGPFDRLLMILGDASYSVYLFHILVLSKGIQILARVPHLTFLLTLSPVRFMLVSVFLSYVVGVGIHYTIERPLTQSLRAIKVPRASYRLQRRFSRPNLGSQPTSP